MAFDFPSSPTEGQIFTPAGGPTYIYRAPVWELAAAAGSSLPEAPADGTVYGRKDVSWQRAVAIAGDTMSGFLTLHADPTAAMHPATKQFVETKETSLNTSIGLKVAKAGDTMTGALVFHYLSPTITMRRNGAGQSNAIISRQVADVNNWVMYLGDGSATDAFAVHRFSDGGGVLSTPFHVARTTGAITLTGAMSFNGNVTMSSPVISQSNLTVNSTLYVSPANNYWSGGTIQVSVTGYKPGGGAWSDTSDIRIKNILGEYARGLDEIAALRPVYYTFKGNDTKEPPEEGKSVPYPNSPHASVVEKNKKFAGLIAQEVETIFPEMVSMADAYIGGEPVNDMRMLDTTPLIFALINAVKELKARVEQLENAT